ncbi:hypothetical protein LCFBJUUZ_CDS0134 [Staphylococcus phage PG-2021_76]
MATEKFNALTTYILQQGIGVTHSTVTVEHKGIDYELEYGVFNEGCIKLTIPELDNEDIVINVFDDAKYDTVGDMLEGYYTHLKERKERREIEKAKQNKIMRSFLGNVKLKSRGK